MQINWLNANLLAERSVFDNYANLLAERSIFANIKMQIYWQNANLLAERSVLLIMGTYWLRGLFC